MQHKLHQLRKSIEGIRYSEDKQSNEHLSHNLNSIKNNFLKDGLQITTKTTFGLGNAINEILEKLQIPEESVKSFVYASPEIQAECFQTEETECVLRFTSGLINLLTLDELKFVIGHEIGHFLFNHSRRIHNSDYIKIQAQEISADRIGLLSAGSFETSFKAILKTVSGLSDDLLKYDISEYMSQMNEYLKYEYLEEKNSTHPSMVLRSRALLWFSLDESSKQINPMLNSGKGLDHIDKRIKKDFAKEAQARIENRKKTLIEAIKVWVVSREIYKIGKLTKEIQKKIENRYGVETNERVKAIFTKIERASLQDIIEKNISESIEAFEDLPKDQVSSILKDMKEDIMSLLA